MRFTRKSLIGLSVLMAVFLAAFGVALAASHFVQVSQEKPSGEIVKGFTVLPEDNIALWKTADGDEEVDEVPFVTWETEDPMREFKFTSNPVLYLENLTNDPVNLRPIMPCGEVADEDGDVVGFVAAEMWNEDGDHMGGTCQNGWGEDEVLKPGDIWKLKLHLFHDGPPGHNQGPSGHVQGPSGHVQGPSGHVQGPSGHDQGPSGHDEGPSGHDEGPSGHDQGPSGHDEGPSGHDDGPSVHDQDHSANALTEATDNNEHGDRMFNLVFGAIGPGEELSRPPGHQHGPSRHEGGPSGHRDGPSGHDHGPSGHDQGPSGHDQGPSGHDEGPSGHDAGPSLHDQGPSGHDEGPSGHDEGPSGHDDGPSVHDQGHSGE